MNERLPPYPSGNSWHTWAQQLVDYLMFRDGAERETAPNTVQLAHKVRGDERALTDGVLMYDPSIGGVVVSKAGAWEPVSGAVAGGSGPQISYSYVSDETTLIDTNSPAARRFFLNTHRYVMLFDLTDFTECRLLVNKQGVAGAAGYKLCMEYRAAGFSTSVANYVDIGTSEVACACNVTNTIVSSGWIALAEGAKADVAVCVTSEGGDGALDPQFGPIVLQFR